MHIKYRKPTPKHLQRRKLPKTPFPVFTFEQMTAKAQHITLIEKKLDAGFLSRVSPSQDSNQHGK
jgi:hypothetical protein